MKVTSKLALFDKDGTLTKTKSGKTFPLTPDDQAPLFDFSKLPSEAKDPSGNVVCYNYGIITNQKGISLALKTEEFLLAELNYLIQDLGFPADIILACPDDGETCLTGQVSRLDMLFDCMSERHPGHLGIPVEFKGKFRKPDPGMILAAPQHFKWAFPWHKGFFDEVVFVGDMESDRQAALAANAQFIWANDFIQMIGS